jgi:hypothetical protein
MGNKWEPLEFGELRLELKAIKDLSSVLQKMRRYVIIRVLGYVLCIAVIGILLNHYATKRLRVSWCAHTNNQPFK